MPLRLYADSVQAVWEPLAYLADLGLVKGRFARNSIVIIVISTTGQGDLPANAQVFWRQLLRKRLPPGYLSDVRFTTFGLGDSSYPK